MFKYKILLLFVLACCTAIIKANSISKAFSALKIYDYFEAKQLFEKAMKSETAAASYGLSIIYLRTDNHFSNIDSAYKFIFQSDSVFQTITLKDKTAYLKYNVCQKSIDSVEKAVHAKAFEVYKSKNSIPELEKFIAHYGSAPQISEAIDLRNSIAYHDALKTDTYQAYQLFMEKYPRSKEVPEAKEKYTFRFFQESTKNNTIKEYETYLEHVPHTPFLNEVENSIYTLSTANGKIKEYHNFIKKYPKNHNVATAWHNIYTIYTADYKTESLVDFRLEYPDYPFSDIVNQEIALSQKHLFGVRENGKWGFADSTGTVVIPCTYEWVENFSEGFAECGLNGKSGFINKSGKLMVPFFYDQVEPFRHGQCVVQQNKKCGIINKNAKLIVPFEYDEISEFFEGLAVVAKQEKYGYINEEGKVVIPINFNKAGDFSDGLAAIELNGLSGFINTSGTVVIPCIYEWTEKFKNGMAKVKKEKKFGIINKNGTYLLPCEYDFLGEFSEDAIMVVNDNKYGFADRKGAVFIPIDYDYSSISVLHNSGLKFKNNMVVAEKNKKQGLIDKAGMYITPKNYERIEPFSSDLAAVLKKGKWGYIDKNMKLQIQYLYLSADEFIDGVAKVEDKKGKKGFINTSGKMAIDFLFDEAETFKNGLSTVIIEGKTGIIDASGAWVIPCELTAITPAYGNVLKFEKDSKFAYYNIVTREYMWKEEGF